MSRTNKPMAPEADQDLLEAAFRKAARRIGAAEPPPSAASDIRGKVFPGTMPSPDGSVPESAVVRNRRPTRRKVSTFNLVVGLLLAAIAIVLYVSNVIAVVRLTAEIGQLEEQHAAMLNEQEMIRAQIARLSGLERIRGIAERDHGMRYSEAVPGWLSVDPQRAAELEALARTAGVRRSP